MDWDADDPENLCLCVDSSYLVFRRAERRTEGLDKAREAKGMAKEKYDVLIATIEESGKSIDGVLEELKQSGWSDAVAGQHHIYFQ